MEEKFNKGDLIVCNGAKDMAVYDKTDKKGYVHFKEYYDRMFNRMKDTKKYIIQNSYLKFWHVATEEEANAYKELRENAKKTDSPLFME